MDLTVDHVPFAWSDLDAVSAEFDRLGLTPEYGGVHGNGVTHMSVLGFDDRSYVELIAEREEGDHGFWPEHVRADAGPAAWCVRVSDVTEECVRVLRTGRPVHGPFHGRREREDGTLVEWDRAEFGADAKRLLYPFAIEDRTPLDYRVSPSPSVAEGPLDGVGQVVLAVEEVERAVEDLQGLYRLPRPVYSTVEGFGTVASFPGQPLAVTDGDREEWIRDRLDRFRECPCAVMLATDDLADARQRFPLSAPRSWPDGRVATFESELFGHRLGVVERP